jgi:hypothetical protein
MRQVATEEVDGVDGSSGGYWFVFLIKGGDWF